MARLGRSHTMAHPNQTNAAPDAHIAAAQEASSPHARGSSGHGDCGHGRPGVVPARAGVFPTRSTGPRSGRRRPRTRGGLPSPRWCRFWTAWSSPHARGSSGGGDDDDAVGSVVPARAGVFPAPTPSRSATRRRPRTRGGLPVGEVLDLAAAESSPHARGSSLFDGRQTCSYLVVPARAGVFLRYGLRRGTRRRHPRTRGVFRPPAQAGRFPEGCPRTRGGLPGRAPGCGPGGASSPHTRGLPPAASSRLRNTPTSPARAGSSSCARVDGGAWPKASSHRPAKAAGHRPSSLRP